MVPVRIVTLILIFKFSVEQALATKNCCFLCNDYGYSPLSFLTISRFLFLNFIFTAILSVSGAVSTYSENYKVPSLGED